MLRRRRYYSVDGVCSADGRGPKGRRNSKSGTTATCAARSGAALLRRYTYVCTGLLAGWRLHCALRSTRSGLFGLALALQLDSGAGDLHRAECEARALGDACTRMYIMFTPYSALRINTPLRTGTLPEQKCALERGRCADAIRAKQTTAAALARHSPAGRAGERLERGRITPRIAPSSLQRAQRSTAQHSTAQHGIDQGASAIWSRARGGAAALHPAHDDTAGGNASSGNACDGGQRTQPVLLAGGRRQALSLRQWTEHCVGARARQMAPLPLRPWRRFLRLFLSE